MLIGHYTIDSAPVESQLKRTLVCHPLIEGMEGVRRVPYLSPHQEGGVKPRKGKEG